MLRYRVQYYIERKTNQHVIVISRNRGGHDYSVTLLRSGGQEVGGVAPF